MRGFVEEVLVLTHGFEILIFASKSKSRHVTKQGVFTLAPF
jgi:uncharacterized protein YhhL (DUF1145 family)